MRAYPLRLPDELADTAREHAERIGISFNAFVAVALDAYLRGGATAANKSPAAKRQPKPKAPPKTKAKPKPATKAAASRHQWHSDPDNWRNFHDPDVWPWTDPDWTPPPGVVSPWTAPGVSDPEDVKPAEIKAYEDAYWRTHQRPSGPWLDGDEVPY
jgi:hypothetical protein